MIGFEARFFFAAEGLLEQRFDGGEHRGFVGADQRDGFTGGAGAAGAADAVDVVFGDDGQVEIDDLRQVVDVQPAGGDVGGDEDLHFAGLEAFQGAQAGRLRFVAVDGIGLDALGLEDADQVVGAAFGFDENQHLAPFPVLAHEQEEFGLALLVDGHHPLFDGLDGAVGRADFDGQRVAQAGLGEATDDFGEGGREEQGLTLLGQGGEDGVEFG